MTAGTTSLFRLMLALAVVAISPSMQAADAAGNFAVKGPGTSLCSDFVSAAQAGDQRLGQYAGYVAGYISSYNEHRANTFDLLAWQNMETVMLMLLRRCDQLPQATFANAVTQLSHFYSEQLLSELPPTETFGDGDNAITLYTPVADEARKALENKGYSGKDLYQSLDQYRQDQNLPAMIDNKQTTLMQLFYTQQK
jgi:hypothetical protein